MGHERLATHFKTNFALKQHHNWDLAYLDGLMPWERYAYIDMLESYLIELEKENKLKEQEERAKRTQLERQIKESVRRK